MTADVEVCVAKEGAHSCAEWDQAIVEDSVGLICRGHNCIHNPLKVLQGNSSEVQHSQYAEENSTILKLYNYVSNSAISWILRMFLTKFVFFTFFRYNYVEA